MIAITCKFQFGVPFYTSLRASAHTGVAIPTDRGCVGYLKGIPTPVLQSAADFPISMIASGNHTVIKCGLVREDVVCVGPKQPDKLQFRNSLTPGRRGGIIIGRKGEFPHFFTQI